MNHPYLQFDIRSWWVGLYINTVKREIHVNVLWLIINIPFSFFRIPFRKQEVNF